jgi:hypothetical protein
VCVCGRWRQRQETQRHGWLSALTPSPRITHQASTLRERLGACRTALATLPDDTCDDAHLCRMLAEARGVLAQKRCLNTSSYA